jgi:FixJ family two-component response regulator
VRTIAVVDDHLRILESLQNLLASCGHKAVTYSSAEMFLAFLLLMDSLKLIA